MIKKTKDLETKVKGTKKEAKASKAKTSTTKKKVSDKNKSSSEIVASTNKAVSSTNKKKTNKRVSKTQKKSSTKKTTSTKKRSYSKKTFLNEYYDLPYNYNQTIVTVLAQTPSNLFVYWEISEKDKKKFKKNYSENFFERTKPILIVYNDTLNYSFEIEINDFANSWYINIKDSKCDYHVELGRRPIPNIQQNNLYGNSESDKPTENSYIPYYVYITSSNEMITPNNRILFNQNQKSLTFRNIKTGQTIEKDINQFKFITNYGIFTIRELYKKLFPNDDFTTDDFFSGNPSSGETSSRTFSSQFK